MIRAFTISFDFEGKTYLALATIKKSENEDPCYSVRVYDHALSRVIPEGCLHYSDREVPKNLEHPMAGRLLHCISESVAAHLRLAQV